jgi:hypothetical protein
MEKFGALHSDGQPANAASIPDSDEDTDRHLDHHPDRHKYFGSDHHSYADSYPHPDCNPHSPAV